MSAGGVVSHQVVGRRCFTNGTIPAVYANGGSLYVIGDEGQGVHGVWLVPEAEPDTVVIVGHPDGRG